MLVSLQFKEIPKTCELFPIKSLGGSCFKQHGLGSGDSPVPDCVTNDYGSENRDCEVGREDHISKPERCSGVRLRLW